MLGNLKEFISVVQSGLSSNANLRQTLQEVQKVQNIFKDKQKVHVETKVNYGVGGDLLEKYQSQWAELHSNSEKNAKAAEEVDKLILELHDSTKARLQSACELANNLAQVPGLTAAVAECMDSIKNVQALMKAVEEDLIEFEDIVERCKMDRWKLDHHYHLSIYKEKKMASLEEIRCKLAKENSDQTFERERRQLADLQLKREISAAAFQLDVSKYLTTGDLPSGAPATPKLSLEQVQLDEDPTDLEKFLDS